MSDYRLPFTSELQGPRRDSPGAPCPTVVVIDGGGHRDGAIAWLRAQADGYRLIHVFTLQEFIAWTNQLQ